MYSWTEFSEMTDVNI